MNVVSHPDVDVARTLASGGVATFARFSVMHGTVSGPVDAAHGDGLGAVHAAYDMTRHTQVGSPQANALKPEFIDRFGVVGSPELCVRRLMELTEQGLDKLVVTGPTLGADPVEARAAFGGSLPTCCPRCAGDSVRRAHPGVRSGP